MGAKTSLLAFTDGDVPLAAARQMKLARRMHYVNGVLVERDPS